MGWGGGSYLPGRGSTPASDLPAARPVGSGRATEGEKENNGTGDRSTVGDPCDLPVQCGSDDHYKSKQKIPVQVLLLALLLLLLLGGWSVG